MKIAQAGIISTSIVVIMGVFIILPPYLPAQKPLVTLLAFDIKDDQNMPQWCYDLSSMLQDRNVTATIFVTGQVAQKYPSCVSSLAERNDIGSLTYDYFNLTGQDYGIQLDEVKSGKDAVDSAGHINSRVFKAPYGQTDGNIYSLLNQSGIVADFSYQNQYNKFYGGQFIRFDDAAYDGTAHAPEFFHGLPTDKPVVIDFNNTTPVSEIDDFVSHLKSRHLLLIDASELTGMDLTVRGGRDH